MAANVTIHHSAFSDRRIAYLGELAGYSTMEALGRLASLWSRCTELQTDRPSAFEIRACIGPRGDQLLIECGLGELVGNEIRVRGCTGRTEWFGDVGPGAPRQTAGGKARAAMAQRDAKGRLLKSSNTPSSNSVAGPVLDVAGPATVQQPSNRPASDPDPETENNQKTHTRVRERHPSAGGIARRIWDYAAKLRPELTTANVAAVPPWPIMPDANHTGWQSLLDRVCELLVGSTPEQAEQVCRNRIDVALAKAKNDGEGQWFASTSLFTPNSFQHWAHQDPKQFARKAAKKQREPGALIGAAPPRTDHPESTTPIAIRDL